MNTRRHFLGSLAATAAFFTVPGAFAEALMQTPAVGFGPFYPDHLPLDTDNDLILINDSLTPAIGEITYVSGRILGPSGEPIRNAMVEIWEADSNGIYIHSKSGGDKSRADKNFQGYGRFLTGGSGEYLFRTIKPVPYPGRTPHIHVKLRHPAFGEVTSQLFVAGEARNASDFLWQGLDADERNEVELRLQKPAAGEPVAWVAERDLLVPAR